MIVIWSLRALYRVCVIWLSISTSRDFPHTIIINQQKFHFENRLKMYLVWMCFECSVCYVWQFYLNDVTWFICTSETVLFSSHCSNDVVMLTSRFCKNGSNLIQITRIILFHTQLLFVWIFPFFIFLCARAIGSHHMSLSLFIAHLLTASRQLLLFSFVTLHCFCHCDDWDLNLV